MRGRAAHVEVADGRAVLRPARDGTKKEELLERQLALEDVALGQAPLALEVERRDDLPVADDVRAGWARTPAMVLTTVSPNASRCSSHVPSAR